MRNTIMRLWRSKASIKNKLSQRVPANICGDSFYLIQMRWNLFPRPRKDAGLITEHGTQDRLRIPVPLPDHTDSFDQIFMCFLSIHYCQTRGAMG